jgi:predicted MFS family arabinose efflux permease
MRTANLSAVLVFGTFSAMFFFVSIFMQHVYGYPAIKAGLAYVPLAVCVAAGAGIASSLITKITARPVLITGLVITVAGLVLLWRAPASGSYPADLLPPFLLTGTGCGMALVTLQVAAFAGISSEQAGLAAGLINTSQEAGGALGLAIVATIAYNGFAARLAAAGQNTVMVRNAQASAGHRAFLATACLGFAALLLAMFVMPRGKRPATASPAPVSQGEGDGGSDELECLALAAGGLGEDGGGGGGSCEVQFRCG